MIIALDFDKTYNAAPSMWDDIISTMEDYGHKVIIATYRHPVEDYDPLFDDLDIDKYFTDGKAKKPFLEALGIKVDIWIDDNVHSIIDDSAWSNDSPELHAWRLENKARLETLV